MNPSFTGSAPAHLRLVVGLGNPGERYRRTRHNLGFQVLDALAERAGVSWQEESRWRGAVARWENLWLLKPLTFMNLSGESVAPLARFHRLAPSQILVVLDDLALPVGRLRLRAQGSDGGQNGLSSILQHLGTTQVPRLRVGIGHPPAGMDAAAHVLAPPSLAETPLLQKSVDAAVETIFIIRDKGLDAAMNHANTHRFIATHE